MQAANSHNLEIRENVPLAPYTTLGVGGPARLFAEVRDENDLQAAVRRAGEEGLPIFVLGGGSNLLVSDAGFPGMVIHMVRRGIVMHSGRTHTTFTAAAGEPWDALVARAVAEDCAGLECLSGIPGTVGGTPVQNVGAYGQEVSETVTQVRAFELASGEVREFTGLECEFAYRSSRFNTHDQGRFAILSVSFALHPRTWPRLRYPDIRRHFEGSNQRPTLQQVREAVLQIRRSKAMLHEEGEEDSRSAGSFFKNPVLSKTKYQELANKAAERGLEPPPAYPATPGAVKVAAAWLVEQAGTSRGFSLGRAGISNQHALAIVNRGGATAAEIIALKDLVQQRVRDAFGVELTPEPVFLGDF